MTVLPVGCLVVALAAALSEVSIYTNATVFAIAAVTTAPIAWIFLKPRAQTTPDSSVDDNSNPG